MRVSVRDDRLPSVIRVHEDGPPTRCTFCHDALAGGHVACAECGASLHEACFAEAGVCGTLGCIGLPRVPDLTRRVLGDREWTEAMRGLPWRGSRFFSFRLVEEVLAASKGAVQTTYEARPIEWRRLDEWLLLVRTSSTRSPFVLVSLTVRADGLTGIGLRDHRTLAEAVRELDPWERERFRRSARNTDA